MGENATRPQTPHPSPPPPDTRAPSLHCPPVTKNLATALSSYTILRAYLSISYCNLIWASTYVNYSESTYYRKELFGRSQRLTIMLQVNLFLLTWKFLTYLAFTLFKWVLLCTYITMVHYLFPLHKFFKLEVRSINTQPDTLTCTDLILVEPILKNFRSCFKVLEYGIRYQTTLKPPQRLTRLSDWSNHF